MSRRSPGGAPSSPDRSRPPGTVGNARRGAIAALEEVLGRGHSLTAVLPEILPSVDPGERAHAQALTFGVLRFHTRLETTLGHLLQRPLKARDLRVKIALMLGLYQLIYLETPAHAAVSETVNAVGAEPWARGLVNACLRRFSRESAKILERVDRDPAARLSHPAWVLEKLSKAWGPRAEAIAGANNAHPPLTLRVNRLRHTRGEYRRRLEQAGIHSAPVPYADEALTVSPPQDVRGLPGFEQGAFSVQDAAAQLAAPLLQLQPGARVLDACAAPGGKTTHLLELEPRLGELVAADIDPKRLDKLRENLARLGHTDQFARIGRAECVDMTSPEPWGKPSRFDRILLDAPCSASGVIRRHPEIKLLRRASDLGPMMANQAALLGRAWEMLVDGGLLLYATCSVFPEENSFQVTRFLEANADAECITIDASWGQAAGPGRQILPGENDMDGFYYALVRKLAGGS